MTLIFSAGPQTGLSIKCKVDNVKLELNHPILSNTAWNASTLQNGTLLVTESSLVWSDPACNVSLSIDYPSIMIHAISRGHNGSIQPFIYCQIASLSEEEDEPCELHLTPQDPTTVDDIFQNMSECSKLHPDPDQQEENEWYSEQDAQAATLDSTGQSVLSHLESLLDSNQSVAAGMKRNINGDPIDCATLMGELEKEGQFDDAPEDGIADR